MSYNIDNWQTIELEDLVVPFNLLEKAFDSDTWLEADGTPYITFYIGEGGGLQGTVDNNQFYIKEAHVYGEGSSWDMDKLEEILTHSTGKLTAFLTWEGGDSHSLLEVNNGEVKHNNINIVELIRKSRENGQEI